MGLGTLKSNLSVPSSTKSPRLKISVKFPHNKQVSLLNLEMFQAADVNATLNQLKYFLFICNCNGSDVSSKDVAAYFQIERHTHNKILQRLVNMEFITLEVINNQRKKIHMAQKGWEFYLKLPD